MVGFFRFPSLPGPEPSRYLIKINLIIAFIFWRPYVSAKALNYLLMLLSKKTPEVPYVWNVSLLLEEGLDLQAFVGKTLAPPNSFALREGEWRKGEDTDAWDVCAAALPWKRWVSNTIKIMFHLLLIWSVHLITVMVCLSSSNPGNSAVPLWLFSFYFQLSWSYFFSLPHCQARDATGSFCKHCWVPNGEALLLLFPAAVSLQSFFTALCSSGGGSVPLPPYWPWGMCQATEFLNLLISQLFELG